MSALSLFEKKDSVWNDIVKPSSNDECIKQRSVSEGGNLPLSRLLAQTYSYSSDSTSPSNSRYSPPQVSNRLIFSYSDSPQSNGSNSSRQSFSYSSSSSGAGSFPSRSFRLSSVGDPGPPTLDDVILMGTLPDNSSTNPKDLSLSDLMNDN
ncbi:hypothetical protein Anas_13445 [Armadillidium nasatum]|uniref:Uncharacterized protein n=1 Tax=Armadillidium nasatum TaxID=96803 RepID=A0A5N5T765_9CRUS|nr:hypothetical protein Anas_13445 [Armadillidium nasatum]